MALTYDKPAGIPVFKPHDDAEGDCVLRRLLAEQPWRNGIHWPEGFEGGMVHRLDNSTSGALLVADDLKELENLRELFTTHRLIKTYLFRSVRDAAWETNTCDKPLAHHRKNRRKMVVQRGNNTPHRGQWYPARTDFRRIGERLFEAKISTGIMHQIRIHGAFVGIPIAGDKLYGGGDTPADAPIGATFLLHHVGLSEPDGFHTGKVPDPAWIKR